MPFPDRPIVEERCRSWCPTQRRAPRSRPPRCIRTSRCSGRGPWSRKIYRNIRRLNDDARGHRSHEARTFGFEQPNLETLLPFGDRIGQNRHCERLLCLSGDRNQGCRLRRRSPDPLWPFRRRGLVAYRDRHFARLRQRHPEGCDRRTVAAFGSERVVDREPGRPDRSLANPGSRPRRLPT